MKSCVPLMLFLLLARGTECATTTTATNVGTTPAPDAGIVVVYNIAVPSCNASLAGTNCTTNAGRDVRVSRIGTSSTASTETWVTVMLVGLGVCVVILFVMWAFLCSRYQKTQGQGYDEVQNPEEQNAQTTGRRVISVELVKQFPPEDRA